MKPHLSFRFLFILVIMLLIPFSLQGVALAEDSQQQSTFASPILVVNTSFLNIRSGPSASYSIIATVVGGSELPVLAVYEDRVWYQVATNIGAGWVNVEFALARGDFSHVPLIEYGSIIATQPVVTVTNLGQGGGGVAPTTNIAGSSGVPVATGVSFMGGDLHTGPSGSSPIVAALVGGNDNQIFPVINIAYEDGRPYYQVNFPGYGVVWGDRFRLRPLECNGLSVIVATEFVGTVSIGISPPIEFSPGDEMYIAGPGRDGLIEIVTRDGTRGLVPVDKTRGRDASIVNYCDGVTGVSGGADVTTATAAVNPGQGGGGGAIVVPAITAAARLVVNTGNLNIRTGPGAGYNILATVPGGVELPVTGIYEDEVWYQVATNLGVGWVNIEFMIARGDFSRVPLIKYGAFANPPAVTVANLGQGGGGVAPMTNIAGPSGIPVATGVSFMGGDLHTGPSGSSPIVAALVGGNDNQIFPVINIAYEDGRPYYQVNFPGYGVVWGDRFRLRPLECNGLSVIVATEFVGTVSIGISPPIEFSPGDEMYIAGPGRDGLIEIVTRDGTRGLVPVDKTRGRDASIVNYCDGVTGVSGGAGVTTATAAVNPGQGGGGVAVVMPATTAAARLVVNTGNLNIRTGPGAGYNILATVPGGVELPVTGIYEDEVWYQVATNLGVGWVNIEFTIARGDFSRVPLIEYGTLNATNIGQGGGTIVTTTAGTTVVVPATTVTSAARVIINTPNLNIRTGPSASFSVVATVSGGTELAVLGVADDGVWYLVQGAFGQGWLNNEFVIFRGDYSAVPMLNINP